MALVIGIKLIRIEELTRYTNLKPLEMSPLEENLQTLNPHCVLKNACISYQYLKNQGTSSFFQNAVDPTAQSLHSHMLTGGWSCANNCHLLDSTKHLLWITIPMQPLIYVMGQPPSSFRFTTFPPKMHKYSIPLVRFYNIHIYMYIYVHIYMYIYIYTYVHMYICITLAGDHLAYR